MSDALTVSGANDVKYFGYIFSYLEDCDMQINFQDYNTALRIINLVFKTTNFKNTQE
jgi:hypothetical protein